MACRVYDLYHLIILPLLPTLFMRTLRTSSRYYYRAYSYSTHKLVLQKEAVINDV